MQITLAELLHAWRDFFSVIAASAATLVGLMFVAASIGTGSFSSERGKIAIRTFLSPTVLHFSAILIIGLVATIPNESWYSFGALLCIVGLNGAGYSIWNSRRMSKQGITASIDIIDRLWYARLPILFYFLIVAAGVSLFLHDDAALDALAIAMVLLLLAGIRNAWDMSVWIIQRREQ